MYNIDPDKLDFTMYHPLDHSLLECKNYPGGKRRHLEYRWEFQWERILREQTLCRIGQHRFVVWYQRRPVEAVFERCMDCGRKK